MVGDVVCSLAQCAILRARWHLTYLLNYLLNPPADVSVFFLTWHTCDTCRE